MLKTEKVTEPKEVAATMECDGCHAVYDFKNKEHLQQINEFICLHRRTSPASIVGGGLELHLDLCQDCFSLMLGKLVTVKNPVTQEAWLGMDKEAGAPIQDEVIEGDMLIPFIGKDTDEDPEKV